MAETALPEEAVKEASKDKEILEVSRTSDPFDSAQGRPERSRGGEKLPELKITFFYLTHSPEAAEKFAPRLKDFDLILAEGTGGTPAERETLNEVLDIITARDFGSHPKDRALAESLTQSPNFLDKLVVALSKSGKTIRQIDVSSEDEAYKMEEDRKRMEGEIFNLIGSGRIDDAFNLYPTYAKRGIEAVHRREDIVLGQVSGVIRNLKEKGESKRIAVIQGAAHTFVHHQFVKDFPEADTSFKLGEPQVGYAGWTAPVPPITLFTRKRN